MNTDFSYYNAFNKLLKELIWDYKSNNNRIKQYIN